MLLALAYVTIVSTILAIVLAVARDVPILHLLLPANTRTGRLAAAVILWPVMAGMLAGMAFKSKVVVAVAWAAAFAYFWMVAAWHLKERR
jgi:hypothetical protein